MMWRNRRGGSHDEALLAALGERLRSAATRIRIRPDFQSSLRTSLTMEAALGERLRDAATEVTPRPDFQSSLRTSLLMEASTALVPAPGEPRAQPVRTVRVVPRRRVTIAAAFVAMALGMGGMASASASALPGEGLYPIKRVAERVELVFHRGLADRGAFKLELAERRLNEARALAAMGEDDRASDSVREFEEAAADGTRDLIASYREDNATASLVVLNQFTDRTEEVLDALASQLPSESTVVDNARDRVEALGSQSEELCPSCGGGSDEGFAPPIDSDPVPEPEPDPAEPPSEPSLPVPPAPGPSDTSTSSQEDDEDEDEDEDEGSDSEEPEAPTPSPTPTPEPTPTPTPEPPCPTTTPTPGPEPEPTPTPTPEPTPCPTPTPEPTPSPEPTEPPEPPAPTDPPTILPEIIPETLEGVGQGVGELVGGTLGGLHLGQNRN